VAGGLVDAAAAVEGGVVGGSAGAGVGGGGAGPEGGAEGVEAGGTAGHGGGGGGRGDVALAVVGQVFGSAQEALGGHGFLLAVGVDAAERGVGVGLRSGRAGAVGVHRGDGVVGVVSEGLRPVGEAVPVVIPRQGLGGGPVVEAGESPGGVVAVGEGARHGAAT